jgi:hypothetical protein
MNRLTALLLLRPSSYIFKFPTGSFAQFRFVSKESEFSEGTAPCLQRFADFKRDQAFFLTIELFSKVRLFQMVGFFSFQFSAERC